MKYTVLPNAKVVMSTDGNKNLFIDTGSGLIPIQEKTHGTEVRRLTFDGNVEGKEVHNGYIKISDECIDPSSISSIRVFRKAPYAYEKDRIYTLTPDILQIFQQGGYCTVSAQIDEAIFMAAIVVVHVPMEGFTCGTYTHAPGSTGYYATEVVYDHVSKLDSKYVSAMPVIHMSIPEWDEASGTALLAEPAASEFRAAYRAGVPLVTMVGYIKEHNVVGTAAVLCSYVSFDDILGYSFQDGSSTFIIVTDEEVFLFDPSYTNN